MWSPAVLEPPGLARAALSPSSFPIATLLQERCILRLLFWLRIQKNHGREQIAMKELLQRKPHEPLFRGDELPPVPIRVIQHQHSHKMFMITICLARSSQLSFHLAKRSPPGPSATFTVFSANTTSKPALKLKNLGVGGNGLFSGKYNMYIFGGRDYGKTGLGLIPQTKNVRKKHV